MTRSGDAPLRQLRWHGGVWLGLIVILALAGAAAAEQARQPDSTALTAQAGSTVAPSVPGSGPTVPPAAAASAPAVPVLTAQSDAALAPLSEQQHRQMMMLLLMNSAGPLGPYGRLGR